MCLLKVVAVAADRVCVDANGSDNVVGNTDDDLHLVQNSPMCDSGSSFLIPLDADGDGQAEPPGTRYGILRGDFGNSFFQKRPVLEIVMDRIPATLELGAMEE